MCLYKCIHGNLLVLFEIYLFHSSEIMKIFSFIVLQIFFCCFAFCILIYVLHKKQFSV